MSIYTLELTEILASGRTLVKVKMGRILTLKSVGQYAAIYFRFKPFIITEETVEEIELMVLDRFDEEEAYRFIRKWYP